MNSSINLRTQFQGNDSEFQVIRSQLPDEFLKFQKIGRNRQQIRAPILTGGSQRTRLQGEGQETETTPYDAIVVRQCHLYKYDKFMKNNGGNFDKRIRNNGDKNRDYGTSKQAN
ncbi:hypothetical protein Nepgr_031840 [Nepenthes gracilis]|uniref:Uncharacterized protein n=1 Tax=Nepenthes gracilis TaxID=150966 RepID=A0AAD3Y560_NEPGR|nr:hypothetical protein Nepgr_031840 [Nepenthes gracilis]